jgi:predicted nucleic acid-binding protein
MSAPYLDTGFALKRYVQEPNSPAAKAALLACTPPLLLTDILEMELVNALHGKVHRREMTEAERDQCLADFQADIGAGFWQRITISPTSLRQRVCALSAKHTATLGTRTLDLLHVAAALEFGCTDFLSFDHRQRQAAQAEGLVVVP